MSSPATSSFAPCPSPPSILILGGEGMLGHKMLQRLTRRYPATRCTILGSLRDPFYSRIPLFNPAATIERVDAMDFPALKQTLARERPDCIINCIGVVTQRLELAGAITAITVNSLLPRQLAEWAAAFGARLIHFSSDCVFSGRKGGYSEADASDANDLYGKTKSLGEIDGHPRVLTLRTSMIGRELANYTGLLEWFLAQKGKRVKGYKKVIYSGVTTHFLADLVSGLISDHPRLSGLYQVTAPAISKHDLLVRIRDAYRLEIEILPDESEFADRSMKGERFRHVTGFAEPSWDEMISQLANDPTPYEQWKS